MAKFKKEEDKNIPQEYMYVNPKARQKGGWWKSKTKAQKATFIMAIALVVLSITALVLLIFARNIFGNEFADSLYGEGVANGFIWIWVKFKENGFRLLYTFLVIIVGFLLGYFLDLFVRLVSASTKRAVTTGSIIRSLIKYAVVIICIGTILTIWGVNVVGIVASLGVLTLIIGLGCQSLISDIVSGVFIVFDDYFDVGDMVIIDGFRGYVEEIGLRTVKINDNCGNVKSITNSSIASCVNLSRHPNYISITLDASYFEDVERLEGIFAQELPLIKQRMPQIIDGPFYKGIGGFTKAGVSYTFACTCEAQYRFQVSRDFKREIYQMFIKNNIIVPFDQLVINQPDPKKRPKANRVQLQEGQRLVKENRKLKTPEGKKPLAKRIRKVVDETANDLKNTL